MYHDAEVQHATDLYQLGLLRAPAAGRSGELLGRGAGSSLEFQEYREYMPGDDIRHLDWGAFARSDTLMVRLYREEISPRTEILLDASRSMTSGGEIKPRVARQLAALFALLAGQLGGRPTVVLLEDGPAQSLSLDALDRLHALPFTARSTLAELLQANHVPLKRQAVRIVISDFLFPHDPASLVRRLAGDASALWLVQLLNGWEADPSAVGGRRLIDIESGSQTDMVIDRKTIQAYLSRLTALRDELLRSCRRAHALFASVIADRGVLTICRDDLCAAGMLRVT